MRPYAVVVDSDARFEENILEPIPQPNKIILSVFMESNYPMNLAEHLKSSVVQGLIILALKNILEKTPIFLKSSKITNVEFNTFSN